MHSLVLNIDNDRDRNFLNNNLTTSKTILATILVLLVFESKNVLL